MKSDRNRLILAAFGISILLSSSGCEPAHSPPPQQQAANVPPPPPPPPPPQAATTPTSPPTAQAPPAQQAAAKDANAGSKKAEVGVGKSHSRLSKSLICTEFAAIYCAREKLVFEVEIPKAMQLFKAAEDRNPKSHEEFMERIIKENQIHLPELWEGETYRYDPKTAELWVDPAPEK
jgi:hypothetical protein